MITLENFQPEIWAHILDIACLDDGSTARSLSLVSRQIHHLSRSHLYYAVKVDSLSQLLKLEDQVSKSIPNSMEGNGYFLKTRFLCITLPTSFFAEAYPDESFVSERIPGDTPYRPWEDGTDSDGSWHTADFSGVESDDDGASRHHEQDEQSLREELEAELADITNDPACKNLGGITISSLSDLLTHPKFSVEGFVYRAYSALRRLLEACADTLEVFSLYFNPWNMIPQELFIPPLPKLQRLSIYILRGWLYIDQHTPQPGLIRPPLLFPSLKIFRMVDSFYFRFDAPKVGWWADIIKSCPDRASIQIITGERVPETPGWKSAVKKQSNIQYQFLTERTIDCIINNRKHRGSNIASQWWLDDVLGSDVVFHAQVADLDMDEVHAAYPSEDSDDDTSSLQRDDTDDETLEAMNNP
ncbi:hypothetical protein H1R20_g10112, partial [Candolleomyces eurysporus]